MQRTYERYKDVAEIHLIYITEAHAVDGRNPVAYAKELGISKHKSYGQRCSVASRLRADKKLTIPTLVDGMDNKVSQAYRAHPDRIFLVRKDGRLAVAGSPGPMGFAPALRRAKRWLAQYKETGKEPELPRPLPEEERKEG
jgi:hypothetical protein